MEIINFTPLEALIGGVFIGLASSLLLLFNGRIFGISGIVGGLLNPKQGDNLWRVLAIVGLLLGGLSAHFFLGTPLKVETEPTPLLLLAGLAVGFGTRIGSGCTSGHGVCGISRFSQRSILATVTFMATGILTVFVVEFLRAQGVL